MIVYLEMVFVPVLLCMGLFAVFGLATLQGFRAMKEKITGLDYNDLIGMRLGIKALIENYQRSIDNGSSLSDYWAAEIVTLKTTLKRIDENRSIER